MAAEPDVRLEGLADATLIDRVHEALDELLAHTAGMDDEDATLFRLAVSEVATNVVAHALAREPVHVTVELGADDDSLSAVFTDTADPALIDLHTVSMPGADAESGRGLAIALAALDELQHETDAGNVWRLRRARRAR
ncbi:ATP-binding protein [Microbacterium hibisci]|uniref:ATP-binding protein n=1 Tax=Microbacterium hibisci TaxID=2036000 RepID=UPI00194431CA|nr:ATP-binding protein [Microbacterium hibisci]